ncbi:hypothetical protein PHYSODRAFT_527190 [Phytophthora sojae]|uniref:Uncharacterized protein n=1 Tax=Phytophthora sojae (strain P6497) TaxID=1094619 RepID=G5A8M5_PHYSP|nr:hypothetical protein PHYSODRAFT_527190 [Phytophthora sojae]EGZ08251.1 hypothetical protein PHYSODRAFT_527190 [Phytophthora sojae]|eukprot:XP_009536423.1 hypothetical protein PHYSODRAFT_527190 [Phytophthora sojae]
MAPYGSDIASIFLRNRRTVNFHLRISHSFAATTSLNIVYLKEEAQSFPTKQSSHHSDYLMLRYAPSKFGGAFHLAGTIAGNCSGNKIERGTTPFLTFTCLIT